MMTQPEKIKLPPYQAYNASGPDWTNSIPEHWNIRRLRNSLFRHTSGVWGADPDGINELPCLRVADFNRNQWGIKVDNPTTRAITPLERQGKIIHAGNLLLEKSGGGDKQAVGIVVLYDHDLEATCSNFIEILVVQGNFDPRYLKFVHSTLYALGVNKRSIKQTTGIQNIDLYNYLSEKFPVPPPEEQAAIVRFLDHADEQIQRYIAGKERLIALLEEQRQALVHQAVTRGLDPSVRLKPSGVEWMGDVPEHWEMRRLGQCTSVSGGATPSMEVNRFWGGSVPWVTPKDMKKDVISDSNMKVTDAAIHETSLQLVEPPVVLMVVRGMILARRVPIAYTTTPVTINQDMKALRTLRGTDAIFLAYSLNSVQEAFKPLIDEAGHGTRRLPTERWRELPITMPPPSEQRAIIEYLDNTKAEINAAIDRSRRQIDLMNEYRTRLIADVVTGQLDVREAAAQLPAAP